MSVRNRKVSLWSLALVSLVCGAGLVWLAPMSGCQGPGLIERSEARQAERKATESQRLAALRYRDTCERLPDGAFDIRQEREGNSTTFLSSATGWLSFSIKRDGRVTRHLVCYQTLVSSGETVISISRLD